MPHPNPPFDTVLESTCKTALSYLASLDQRSVAATVDLATLRSRFGKQLTQNGVPAEQVIADLVADVEGGLLDPTVDVN